MPLVTTPPPEGSLPVLRAALQERLRDAVQRSALMNSGMQVGAPLRWMTWGIEDGAPLLVEAATTQYVFPILGANAAGLAAMLLTDGQWAFAGIRTGEVADRLLASCALAEMALADVPEPIEARVVEVPALDFLALWLVAAKSDRFVSLFDGRPRGSAPLTVEPGLEQALLNRLKGEMQA